MELYKVYAVGVKPPFHAFLGDFAELQSAKAVIRGFNDTQHKIINSLDLLKKAQTFSDLENSCSVKVYKWIIGEVTDDSSRGTLIGR